SGAHTVNGVNYNSPTCGGAPAVKGIGNAAAEKIWYRALTVYMTTTTNFKGARTASLKAAADLFGGTASVQYKAVAASWTAVNVKEAPPGLAKSDLNVGSLADRRRAGTELIGHERPQPCIGL